MGRPCHWSQCQYGVSSAGTTTCDQRGPGGCRDLQTRRIRNVVPLDASLIALGSHRQLQPGFDAPKQPAAHANPREQWPQFAARYFRRTSWHGFNEVRAATDPLLAGLRTDRTQKVGGIGEVQRWSPGMSPWREPIAFAPMGAGSLPLGLALSGAATVALLRGAVIMTR